MSYLSQPSIPASFGYDIQEAVIVDAWLTCQPSPVPDQLGWDTVKKLRMVSYGLYLAFEQGRNTPPMVLAWRDQPDVDLANHVEVGYELHAAGQPGHRDGPVPEPIARFHDPIDAFVVAMAAKIDEQVAKHPQRPGTLLVQYGKLTYPAQILINAAMLEVAALILDRIEQHMVLRPTVFAGDSQFLGLGDDVAPGLVAGWQRWLQARD